MPSQEPSHDAPTEAPETVAEDGHAVRSAPFRGLGFSGRVLLPKHARFCWDSLPASTQSYIECHLENLVAMAREVSLTEFKRLVPFDTERDVFYARVGGVRVAYDIDSLSRALFIRNLEVEPAEAPVQ